MFINVYMPTDYGTIESKTAYLETIAELDGFISAQSFDNLIICGDFKYYVDFSRPSHHHNLLTSFMHSHNLVRADIRSDIKFSHRRDDYLAFSWPDHILSVGHHAHLIRDIKCEDSVNNFSDHLPLVIFCCFSCSFDSAFPDSSSL